MVRSWAARRDLHRLDPGSGQYHVERFGELAGPVPDQEPEPCGPLPKSISRFRACCTAHAPSGCALTPRTWTWRVPTSITKNTYKRRKVTAQPAWKTSQELRCQAAVFSGLAAVCGQAVASS